MKLWSTWCRAKNYECELWETSGRITVFPSPANDKPDANDKNDELSTAYATTSNKRLLENLMKETKTHAFWEYWVQKLKYVKTNEFLRHFRSFGIQTQKNNPNIFSLHNHLQVEKVILRDLGVRIQHYSQEEKLSFKSISIPMALFRFFGVTVNWWILICWIHKLPQKKLCIKIFTEKIKPVGREKNKCEARTILKVK